MHLHILGIGGTFMSALAILAREAGFEVSGCDENCYPPVSDLLKAKGIQWFEGYEEETLALKADCVIVGNAIKRGVPVLETLLNAGKKYTSGPQWLAENILSKYRVLAVAGTHGKTTTTSMLAFILQQAGLDPGFLIGGVASNFNTSAYLGKGKWFVIEADEYDSAFFDKRPKFMHYRPEIAVLNNLEFDHGDIYPNLEAIQQQFHYYLKTIPKKGIVIKPQDNLALNQVLEKGIFSSVEELAFSKLGSKEIPSPLATWRAELLDEQGSAFRVWHRGKVITEIHWPLIGQFNIENGLAAIAASYHTGINIQMAAKSLAEFKPVKRRLEIKSTSFGITVYDDFAHHPTAIFKTIEALKNSRRHQRIVIILEFASYTMKTGLHAHALANALAFADYAYFLNPSHFNLASLMNNCSFPYQIFPNTRAILDAIVENIYPGDGILIMSNRGFDNLTHDLISQIKAKYKVLAN